MKQIIHTYRIHNLIKRVVVALFTLLLAVPAFVLIAQKVKYYNAPVRISYFYEALRRETDTDALQCLFQSDCLYNQRMDWRKQELYGPIAINGEKVYLIKMDDAYFAAMIADGNSEETVGGIHTQMDQKMREEIDRYVEEQGLVEEELQFSYHIAAYVLHQGYVGNLSKPLFWGFCIWIMAVVIGGVIMLILIRFNDEAKAYRAYRLLSVQNRREADREVCHLAQVKDLLFGAHLLYYRCKEKGAIHVLPYARIVWACYSKESILLYDRNHKKSRIPVSYEDYLRLQKNAPTALYGGEEINAHLAAHDFDALLEKAKQKKLDIWRKKQFPYQDQAFSEVKETEDEHD